MSSSIETFIRREDAERFIEELRGSSRRRSRAASYLRIEERELAAGGMS